MDGRLIEKTTADNGAGSLTNGLLRGLCLAVDKRRRSLIGTGFGAKYKL